MFVSTVAVLAVAPPVTLKAAAINIVVDGTPVQFAGQGPLEKDGRVLVPVRGVLEAMGAKVGYNPRARSVYAHKDGKGVTLGIGQKLATVDNEEAVLDTPPVVIHGSVMVPLRFVGEALGAQVTWDASRQTIDIKTTPIENQP